MTCDVRNRDKWDHYPKKLYVLHMDIQLLDTYPTVVHLDHKLKIIKTKIAVVFLKKYHYKTRLYKIGTSCMMISLGCATIVMFKYFCMEKLCR